jgi:hypothetical protein
VLISNNAANSHLNRALVVPLTFKPSIYWQKENFPQVPHLREVVLWPSP